MSEKQIQVRLSGENINPRTVRASDLANFIRDTEELALSQIKVIFPAVNKDEFILSLVEISDGSLQLGYSSPQIDMAIPALVDISRALNTGNFESIASKAIEKITDIKNFTKRLNCTAEISTLNGKESILATISAETIIETPPKIKGETTIYGKLIRIGGKTQPVATLQLSDTETIGCDLGVDMAKDLAHHLYSWVGLIGVAEWSVIDQRIQSFRAKRISEYEDQPILDSFKWLRENLGKYFNDIDDPDKYIKNARGRSEK